LQPPRLGRVLAQPYLLNAQALDLCFQFAVLAANAAQV
jgi:hypothetical protein